MTSNSECSCTHHTESVRNIPVLFEIGHMEIDFVANLDPFDVVRDKVRANRTHVYMHRLTVAFDTRLVLGLDRVRILVLIDWIPPHRSVLDHCRRKRLRVMRFADGREIEQQFHLVAGDIDQLR